MCSADEELLFRREMPRLFLLVIAFWEASVSQSEVVCFFAMILNHMVSASLLSLPYPLAVFLWAMLAVPRPAKTYWVTVITYAEVCYCSYLEPRICCVTSLGIKLAVLCTGGGRR